jgi:periplasmic protein TonB
MAVPPAIESPIFLPPAPRGYGNPFGAIFVLTIALFLGAGLYLRTIKPPPVSGFDEKKTELIKTRFLIAENKKPELRQPPSRPEKKAAPKEVVDLTKAPLLNQKTDFNAPGPAQRTVAQAARPVYGLRRVYSTGFGAGGAASDAVIGKVGNTLNKDIDTITAAKKDLIGTLVSMSSVSTAPRLTHDVKPEYTKEMIAAKVEGVIRAELLVDTDGKVKELKILNDLGYGTRERAREAFLKWKFAPALRDGKPVAVWISYSIRFVLLQE